MHRRPASRIEAFIHGAAEDVEEGGGGGIREMEGGVREGGREEEEGRDMEGFLRSSFVRDVCMFVHLNVGPEIIVLIGSVG